MIEVQFRWLNDDGTITSRTLKKNFVPRVGEHESFDAKGRKKEGIVHSVTSIDTDNGERVVVVLK